MTHTKDLTLKQAVADLRKRFDYIRKCYHNHFDRDAYDGLGSMNQEMSILNSLAAVADMLEAADIIGEDEPEHAWTYENPDIGVRNQLRAQQRRQLQTLITELRRI